MKVYRIYIDNQFDYKKINSSIIKSITYLLYYTFLLKY